MFRRRLSLVLSLLAAAVVVEGIGAAATLRVAERQVQRGRVASDIQRGFVELSADKQRLRTWVAQLQQGAGADETVRQQLQAQMRATLAQLQQWADLALALDEDHGDSASRSEHLRRQDALAVLTRSLADLEKAVAQARPLLPGADARQAWQALSAVFDLSQGRDLRQLLAENIAREAEAVQRERAAADTTLAWMRGLWLLMAGTLAAAALLAAGYFTRALRGPLDRLIEGTEALQQGRLQHRIALSGRDEFSAVAHSINTLAAELQHHRQQETQQRQELEALVQARTAALQEALGALQQADSRRRQLLADISHELRPPTTAIRGEAEITLRGPERGADEYRSALRRIIDTSRDLGHVIDDLLAVARQDLDALSLVKQPLDPAGPLAEALAQAAALAAQSQVQLSAAELPTGRWQLMGDAQRLRQLLLVLLDNAVRYSSAGGEVNLAVAEAAAPDTAAAPGAPADALRWLQVDVLDRGIGITPQELPQVFERHFRGSAARRHRADGSGLGLAIARALTLAHGGRLELMPRHGGGTRARVLLPLLPSPASAYADTDADARTHAGKPDTTAA
jgi:signal transduction histidine kinase